MALRKRRGLLLKSTKDCKVRAYWKNLLTCYVILHTELPAVSYAGDGANNVSELCFRLTRLNQVPRRRVSILV